MAQQTEETTCIILAKFNTFPNYTTSLKNSKTTQIHTKLLQKQEYARDFEDFQNNDRGLALKSEKNNLDSFFLNNKNTKYLMSDLFFNKKQKAFSEIIDKQFFLLAPKLISNYIANQLNRMTNLSRSSFKLNLSGGILRFSYQLLRRLQTSIIGLKVICSGK
jgi:hypothetical protein